MTYQKSVKASIPLKSLLAVGVAALIAVVYLVNRTSRESSTGHISGDANPSSQSSSTASKTGAPTASTASLQARAAEPMEQVEALNVAIDRDPTHTTPFSTSIIRLAKEHPELGLTEADVTTIQKAYTDLSFARLRLEVSLAKITPINDHENYVEIPAYKERGEALSDQLKKAVLDQMAGRSAGVVDAITTLFEGDNSALGKVEQKLVISTVNTPAYDYKVVREMVFNDPKTGAITGKSTGIDQVKRQSMGSYAAQTEFFPPIHKP